MHTKELQYRQVNNLLMEFHKSSLPIGIFGSFKLDKLKVSSSNSVIEIEKALKIKLHDETITVRVDWGKYTMKQAREYFTLTVKYNNKTVDALTVKFRINFKKINATTKVSISQTQVMWNKDMYVDMVVEPNHSQSDMWKFLPDTKVLKILPNSKFKPVDGNNEVQFDVLEKKNIRLKYEHSMPIMPPITMNQSERIDAMIDTEQTSLGITLMPNNSPNYSINIIRLTPSYTIGCNKLDLWKLQIVDKNQYAFLSINNVITDSDILKIKPINEREWLISLKSVKLFKRLPSSDISANIEVQASSISNKKIELILSTIPNDDVHYVNIKEEDCLQINIKNEVNTPVIVYKDNPAKQVSFNLNNVSSIVEVENIKISSNDDNVQFEEDNREIKSLKPNRSIPIFATINPNISLGSHKTIISVVGEYTKKYSYELNYEIKEKKHCSLNVEIVKNSFVETFAEEEYTNHKVCEIMLTACVDENYGIEGSLPIIVSDIKVSQLFCIRTNTVQIEPRKSIQCDLVLNGSIGHSEEVNDFNKLIAFKYEHE